MKYIVLKITAFLILALCYSCTEPIPGCTNENAYNYSPNANTDDGSCISIVLGCTDKEALNFNEDANTDDGSCKNELDIAYEFVKKNLKDPYSAQFESGGSWDLPSFQRDYPCIKVKYLDVRAKNSWGAYNLERYYASFKDGELIPELIADGNQSDGDIGSMLEVMCIIHEIECSQNKIISNEQNESHTDKQILSFTEASSLMRTHSSGSGQIIVDKLEYESDGLILYLFLTESIDYSGNFCVTSVGTTRFIEFKDGILSVDCGGSEKRQQMENLKQIYSQNSEDKTKSNNIENDNTKNGEINVDNLNFRSSPDFSDNIIEKLEIGTLVEILGVEKKSIKNVTQCLLIDDHNILCNNEQLKLNKNKVLDIVDDLNEKIVCKVSFDEFDCEFTIETNKVELIDYQNWSKIKVKNQIGYVYERFITVN